MISFCVFMIANFKFPFQFQKKFKLTLKKYPQVHWELYNGASILIHKQNFIGCFCFVFFCFRTWFHWGWGVKLSPKIWDCSWYDTSRRLTAPDIFRVLWSEISVDMSFFCLPAFSSFCFLLTYYMLVFYLTSIKHEVWLLSADEVETLIRSFLLFFNVFSV